VTKDRLVVDENRAAVVVDAAEVEVAAAGEEMVRVLRLEESSLRHMVDDEDDANVVVSGKIVFSFWC